METEAVRSYVLAGVLVPDESGMFHAPDIARTRLVAALVEAGVDLDDLAAAIGDGRLSLGYVDHLMPDPVRLVPAPSAGDAASPLAFEEMIQPILGTQRGPDAPIREDDLAILGLVARAVELGAPVDRIVRIVRAIGQAATKIVELQRDFVDEVLLGPAIERTGSPIAALEVTSQDRFEYRDLGRRLSGLLLERFVDDAIFKNLVQLTESVLVAGGIDAPSQQETVVFIDVSDYTKLSEQEGDLASAHQAVLLADFVHDLANLHGSRLVKSLGDGAMVHAPNASGGLALALDAVTEAETAGLWALHAGVNTGRMVRRDGDFYGTAVNIASRVADQAGPGEVLVTRAVVDTGTGDDIDFTPLGEVALKNVGQPVALYRAAHHPRQSD